MERVFNVFQVFKLYQHHVSAAKFLSIFTVILRPDVFVLSTATIKGVSFSSGH